MPIPILKGLRRGGPTVDPPRTPTPLAKTPSPRSSFKTTSASCGMTTSAPSNIPSFQGGGKEARGGRIAPLLKPGSRGVVSRGGIHSPRPPPRVSSSIVTSPRPPTKIMGNGRDQEIKIKTAQIRPSEPLREGCNNYSNSNNLVIPPSSSNRSSVISNSSSIPAPSSSSSNRNSNSSIGSNFSVNSWNEDKPFIGSGSDTFPRASATRRSFNITEGDGLTTSLHVDCPMHARNTAHKTLHKYRSRESSKNGSSKLPNSALSSSESAIAHPKTSQEVSNRSDSNLSRLKIEKPMTDFRNLNSRTTIPKPCGGSLRSTNNSNINANFNGHSYLPTTNRSADPNSNKAQQAHSESNHSSSRLHKPKQKSFNSQLRGKEDSRLLMRAIRNGSVNSNLVDSTDEDDGYSSVAHNDQQEEEMNNFSAISEDNDYDEVEEICEIEPMKPLEGLSRYSYVLNVESSNHHFKDFAENVTLKTSSDTINVFTKNWNDSSSSNNRNAFENHSAASSKATTDMSRDSHFGISDQKLNNLSPGNNRKSKLKFENLSPRFIRLSETALKPLPSRIVKSKVETTNLNPSGSLGPASSKLPQQGIVNSGKPSIQIVQTNSDSILDDSVLSISYKNFVKVTKPIVGKDTYNWTSRNTIAVSVPLTPPRRRNDLTSTPSTFNSPSLPTLAPSHQVEGSCDNKSVQSSAWNSKSAPPTRPTSLASPGKLNFCRSSFSSSALPPQQFYRTGSLRSPRDELNSTNSDRKLTYPYSRNTLTGTLSPLPSSPTSGLKTFVRNSPKYSTVIPRTMKQDQKMNANFSTDCNNQNNVVHSINTEPGNNSKYPFSADDYEPLRKELKAAKEKILSMTEQLNSSNKLVAAYEHSLSNMTQRLQHLTKVTEQKDTEATELRRTLERVCLDSSGTDSRSSTLRSQLNRSSSIESLTSLASNASFSSAISSSSSVSFASSSNNSGDPDARDKATNKKKSWLRSSFSKAFKRREKRKRSDILPTGSSGRHIPLSDSLECPESVADVPGFRGFCSLPSSPLPQRYLPQRGDDSYSDVEIGDKSELKICALIEDISRLKRMLRDKDTALTESRLESLSSAHQIESLKESIHQISTELSALRMEKDDTARSSSCDDRLSLLEYDNDSICNSRLSFTKSDNIDHEKGKSVKVFVPRNDPDRGLGLNYYEMPSDRSYLGSIKIHCRTSWEQLDGLVSDVFEEYLSYLDPVTKLSLDSDSILHYQLGEVSRTPMLDAPELLPYGYLIGDVDSIAVTLQTPFLNSIDSIAFETLFSKTHLQRYVALLKEHRRIILSGPEGTGKSYLARRLAEFVVQRLGIEPSLGNIAKFNIQQHTAEDLSTYLSQISDLCETKSTDLPLVIIIESLEKVHKLSEILIASLRVTHDQCPFIICTARHCGKRINTIKTHHSFRLISLDPSQDPVINILPRLCLRNLQMLKANPDLSSENLESLFDWLPRCWNLINKVLASSSSAFGPGVLLPFPFSLNDAQLWFFDIWKNLLLPKLQKAAENLSPLPTDLENWQELDKCLREHLPWSTNNDVTLPGIKPAN